MLPRNLTMRRWLAPILLLIAGCPVSGGLSGAEAIAAVRPVQAKAAREALVERLRNPDPDIRAQAARALRELHAADPALQAAEAAKQHWEEQIRKITPGMTLAEVARLFPPLLRSGLIPASDRRALKDPASDPFSSAVDYSLKVSGNTACYDWRLDSFWVIHSWFDFFPLSPKIRNDLPPVLEHQACKIDVPVPANYTGIWITWHVNGQKAQESQLRDGRYHGVFITYFDNGEPSCEQHYENGVCSGMDCGWFRGGKKSYEGQYANGKRTGVWTYWHSNGTMSLQETFADGLKQGRSSQWDENGKLQAQSDYCRDVLHGLDKAWDKDGSLLWSRQYEHGKRIQTD